MNRKQISAIGGLLLGACATARADDTITNINLCTLTSCNNSWIYQYNGSTIAAAPVTGNTGTGISFPDWNGQDVAIGPASSGSLYSGSATLTFGSPILLNSDAVVNTLMSNFYGTANAVQAVVTFTNSKGATASFTLVGDQTIRDYNNYIYTNALQGFNSNPAYGQVTAQEWWNDNAQIGNDSTQRLDVQSFTLPAGWSGSDLVSMTISDPSSGDWDVLSGVQVDDHGSAVTSVPEPGTWALMGLGLAGLGWVRRRRTA